MELVIVFRGYPPGQLPLTVPSPRNPGFTGLTHVWVGPDITEHQFVKIRYLLYSTTIQKVHKHNIHRSHVSNWVFTYRWTKVNWTTHTIYPKYMIYKSVKSTLENTTYFNILWLYIYLIIPSSCDSSKHKASISNVINIDTIKLQSGLLPWAI